MGLRKDAEELCDDGCLLDGWRKASEETKKLRWVPGGGDCFIRPTRAGDIGDMFVRMPGNEEGRWKARCNISLVAK